MSEATEPQRLSVLLEHARSGAPGALASVFEQAYPELCKLAHGRLRGRDQGAGAALETTALVHETFLRLAQQDGLPVADRAHFFKYAGRVMRTVIVDCVRERMAQRRGSGAPHVSLSTELRASGLGGEEEILRVHEALDSLAAYDPRLIEVVQLRYFGGMTDSEIAEVLGVTDRTVRRDWDKARLLLSEALAP
jgi:RNA polymerase sigma factor (TIGR02999 family)